MSKDKINNLIKFTEFDHLQSLQKPNDKTEIGGFSVLEGLSVKELVKKAAEVSGIRKKELRDMSPKKLKKIIGENKEKYGKPSDKKEVQVQDEDEKNESVLFEKKASAKQKAARAKFMEMINSKKKGKEKEEKNESVLLEKKASAKQKAARARFMDMINSKKKGKEKDVECHTCKK